MIIQIGGTGFIGKHVCVALQKKGVRGMTFSNNPDTAFLSKNAPGIEGFHIDEIRNAELENALANSKTLIYLASQSTPATELNSIETEFKNNILPAVSTIDFVSSINPLIHVIYLSSGGTVYGPDHVSPINEMAQTEPATPYALGKVMMENYLKLKANTCKLRYTILRASNPVGKWHGNLKQGFIGATLSRIKSGRAINIYGDGEIIRDYIDADELARAIIECAENSETSASKTWNVGTGKGTSINQIVSELNKLRGAPIAVNYQEGRESDLQYSVLDSSLIKDSLGWSAKKEISEILKEQWKLSMSLD